MKLIHAILILLIACTPPIPRKSHVAGSGLTGVWEGAFVVTSAGQVASHPAIPEIRGVVVLFQSPWLERRYGLTDPMSLEGVYDVDFTPLGFEARPQEQMPLASAVLTGDSSVLIRLNPYVSQGAVVLEGMVQSESLVGHWYYELPGGASGRFHLTRE